MLSDKCHKSGIFFSIGAFHFSFPKVSQSFRNPKILKTGKTKPTKNTLKTSLIVEGLESTFFFVIDVSIHQ